MRRLSTIAALGAALALTLSACGSDSDSDSAGDGPNLTGFDTSGIEKVDEIADMVPDSVAADGKLTIGTNIYYAPAEFYDTDGKTPIGYDIDMMKALAAVMGLEADIQQAEFAAIMPGIPGKFDMGIANISVTTERQENFNMIPYFATGSSWAVVKDNPSDFDPSDICGTTVGVQIGTVQDDELAAMDFSSCDQAPDIQRYNEQSAVTTAVVGSKLDAMYADSSVADYAVAQTSGQLETIGEPTGVVPIGIVVSADDAEFTEVTVAALQYLMDEGYLADIFSAWGIEDNVSTEALVNPVK
ncbi:ABC transporter substrate-binding protein [Actinomycetaceae bacterium L2_0104]